MNVELMTETTVRKTGVTITLTMDEADDIIRALNMAHTCTSMVASKYFGPLDYKSAIGRLSGLSYLIRQELKREV